MENKLKLLLTVAFLLVNFAQAQRAKIDRTISNVEMDYKKMKDPRCSQVLYNKNKKIYYEPYMLKDKYKKKEEKLYITYEVLTHKVPVCPYALPIRVIEASRKAPKKK